MRRVALLLVGAALAGLAACSGPAPTPAPPTAPTTEPDSADETLPPVTVTASPAPAGPDPLVFFRAQQAACDQHAAATANPPVEPDRFARAHVVRDLGGGDTLIEDGRGTKLVVEPAQGIVLPESGEPSDVMPVPYGFGCSEKIFVGANPD